MAQRKKKGPAGSYLYESIEDRYGKDLRYVAVLDRLFQEEFNRDSTLDDAIDMDELANREKFGAKALADIHARSWEEKSQFDSKTKAHSYNPFLQSFHFQ